MTSHGSFTIFTGPTGAGKSTIIRQLIASGEELHRMIKDTTRPDRAGEVDPDTRHDPNFAKRMSEPDRFLVYSMNQNLYSLDLNESDEHMGANKRVAAVVTDLAAIERLRARYPGRVTVLFVHRDGTLETLRELTQQRLSGGAIVTPGSDLAKQVESETMVRWYAREAFYNELAMGVRYVDHTVFNNGSIGRAVQWARRIINASNR